MTNSWTPPLVNSKDGVAQMIINAARLFTLRESRRTSDSVLLRVRSKELRLVPFREIDVGQASEPEGYSSRSLRKAICRGLQVINSPRTIHSKSIKVKLPCLMSHRACACGIIGQQSAMKQLQKRKEFHL